MKKPCAVVALFALCVLATGGMLVGEEPPTTPPKNLKKVGDHWTPWDPPAPGPDAYVIQKGDTLWDLAGKWFEDPYLWPQIWDENRYILDSHWIYPGDPLVVPGRPTVVPAEGVPPVAEEPGTAPPAAAETAPPADATAVAREERAAPPLPPPPPLLPMADGVDLYCSGYIDPEPPAPSLWISGRDSERVHVGEGDVVFLNRGHDAGLRAGDEWFVQRRTGVVRHPDSGDEIGTMVRRLGKLRVMLVHDTSATAVIEMSCEDIVDGDEISPWHEVPVPMLATLPPFDRWDPTPSGGAAGFVVAARDNLSAVGEGNVIYTDLGSAEGVVPGDVLTLFRPRAENQPRRNLGQAVILTVGEDTSMAKIVLSVVESTIGDLVEVRR